MMYAICAMTMFSYSTGLNMLIDENLSSQKTSNFLLDDIYFLWTYKTPILFQVEH